MKRTLLAMLLLLLYVGCGGGNSGGNTGGTGGGTGGTSAATTINVFEGNLFPTPSQVLQFSKTASGSVSPISTITGPADVLFEEMAVDASGNVYVGGKMASPPSYPQTGIEILVYGPEASGTATPVRTLNGQAVWPAQTTMRILSMAVDAAQNLYVATDENAVPGSNPPSTTTLWQGVAVFSSTANGSAAPTRDIAGNATEIQAISQIAVDSTGNIYVASVLGLGPSSILIFNSSATGNMPPTNSLASSDTDFYQVKGVAVDTAGNIYVSALSEATPPAVGRPSVLEFSTGSTGNATPIRTISGSATMLDTGALGNIAVDSAGNIYVLSGATILKFPSSASGNVPPTAAITSSSFYQSGSSIAVQ
jgi:hypothetical protein